MHRAVPSSQQGVRLRSAPGQEGLALPCCFITACHPITDSAAQLHPPRTFHVDKADRSVVSHTHNGMADKPEAKPQKPSKR